MNLRYIPLNSGVLESLGSTKRRLSTSLRYECLQQGSSLGMLPLILTVLSRDYIVPPMIVPTTDC